LKLEAEIYKMDEIIKQLKNKAEWVRRETLKIHKIALETRIAFSL